MKHAPTKQARKGFPWQPWHTLAESGVVQKETLRWHSRFLEVTSVFQDVYEGNNQKYVSRNVSKLSQSLQRRIWVDLKLLKWPNYSYPSQMQCVFMWLCGRLIFWRTHKLTFWFTWICSFVRRRTTGCVGGIRMVGHWDEEEDHRCWLCPLQSPQRGDFHLLKKGICHLILKRCRTPLAIVVTSKNRNLKIFLEDSGILNHFVWLPKEKMPTSLVPDAARMCSLDVWRWYAAYTARYKWFRIPANVIVTQAWHVSVYNMYRTWKQIMTHTSENTCVRYIQNKTKQSYTEYW